MPLKVIESRKEFDWSVNKPVEFRPYIKNIAGRKRMFFLGTVSAIREGSGKFDGSATPDLALIDSEYRDVVWIDAKHPSKWDSFVYEQLGEAWKESETSNAFFKDHKNDFSILDKNQVLLDSIQKLSVQNQKLDAQKIREAILRSSSDSPLVTIAKSIMEVNNVNQVISLKKKIASYELNPNSVFRNGEYVYDSKNQQNEVSWGLVDDDIKYTKWLVLIDNLQNADYLWEFDNSDGHNSLVLAIEALAKKKKYILPNIPKVDDDNLTVAETLGMFNTTLHEQGLALIELYIDSDSHVAGLIKLENLEQLKKNARLEGYSIYEY